MVKIMDFNRKWFLDGAMGSMLQLYGLKPGESSDTQNLINGDAVVEVHCKYLEAGADILTANTFGSYSLHHDNADEIIKAAVKHMQTAIQKCGGEKKLMALDMGPTGHLLEPYGDLTYKDCHETFLQAAQAGASAGVDLILIETMMSLDELKAAVQAAKTTGLPVIASMSFDKSGKTMMGDDIPTMASEMENLGADVVGMNCGYGPELYEELIPQLAACTELPIMVQPNAGLPDMIDGNAHYSMTPDVFAQSMERISRQSAICVLGGCCGTTPEHIREMIKVCRA